LAGNDGRFLITGTVDSSPLPIGIILNVTSD
jgi:hypothetical protein